MKRFLFSLAFAAVALVGSLDSVNAQVINPSKGIDVSGNAKSPVITVFNQSSSTVIGIICGRNNIDFARPIPPDGASNVNFGAWACPNGSHIAVFTSDHVQHFIPFVDIRASTLIRIPDHWANF